MTLFNPQSFPRSQALQGGWPHTEEAEAGEGDADSPQVTLSMRQSCQGRAQVLDVTEWEAGPAGPAWQPGKVIVTVTTAMAASAASLSLIHPVLTGPRRQLRHREVRLRVQGHAVNVSEMRRI